MAWVLSRMTLEREPSAVENSESFSTRIKEGFRYAATHSLLFPAFILISVVSLMGMSMQMVLLPVIADRHLGGDAATLGYLTSAMGLGAVVGALGLALRKTTEGIEKLPPTAFGLYGLLSILLAYTRTLSTALFLCALMGICIVFGWSSSNTLLQTISEKRMLSRVMSIYMMCFSGMSPVGGLFMGWFSTNTTTSTAMVTGGLFCSLAAVIFLVQIRNFHPETEATST
jgi:MFS family permease